MSVLVMERDLMRVLEEATDQELVELQDFYADALLEVSIEKIKRMGDA